MGLLSTKQAAEEKNTSPEVIRQAIKRGNIDSVKVGGVHLVKNNSKFRQWELSDRHKRAAESRWQSKAN
jgi:hypothetical protein